MPSPQKKKPRFTVRELIRGQSLQNRGATSQVEQVSKKQSLQGAKATVVNMPRRQSSGGGGGQSVRGSQVTVNQPTATPTSVTPATSVATTSGIQPPSIVDRVKQAYRNYNNPNNPTSTALNPLFSGSQVSSYQKPLSESGTPASNVYAFQQQQRATRTDLSPNYTPVTLGQAYERAQTNVSLEAQSITKDEINQAQQRVDLKLKEKAIELQRKVNDGSKSVEQATQDYAIYGQIVTAEENKNLGTNKRIVQAREKQLFIENELNKQYGGAKLSATPSSTKASEGLYNYFTKPTGLPLDAALIAIPAARAAKLEADIVETNIILRGGNKAVARGLAVDTALVGVVKAPKIKQQFAVATVKEAGGFKQTTAYTVDVYKKKTKGVSSALAKDLRVETEYFDVGKNKVVTKIEQPRGASVFTRRGGASSAGMYVDSQFKTALTKQVPFYKSEGFLYKEGTGNKIQQFSADSFVKRLDKGKFSDLYQVKSGKYMDGFARRGKYMDGFAEQARIYVLSAKRTRATRSFSNEGTLFTVKKQSTKPVFPVMQIEAQEVKITEPSFKQINKGTVVTQVRQSTKENSKLMPVQSQATSAQFKERFKEIEKQANRGKVALIAKTVARTSGRNSQRFALAQPQGIAQLEKQFTKQTFKTLPRFKPSKFARPSRSFGDVKFSFGGFTFVPPNTSARFGEERTYKERAEIKNKKRNLYYPDYAAAFLGLKKRIPKGASNRIYSGLKPKPIAI